MGEMEEAVSAAKEKWEKKLAPARAEFHEKLNQVKLAAAKAGTARVKAVKFAKKEKMAKGRQRKNFTRRSARPSTQRLPWGTSVRKWRYGRVRQKVRIAMRHQAWWSGRRNESYSIIR